MVRYLNRKELDRLLKMMMIIHKDRSVARILAATMRKPLNGQQISKICDIPPVQCFRTIKKLKENGFLKVVKKVRVKGRPDTPVFFYKAQLDQKFFHFENGRFKVKIPAVFRLSNGKEIELKPLFESHSSVN